MAYTFEQLLAADPSNPSNIAQNGSITIFAPGDVTMTPLTITDPDGSPLPNPFTVNANGFGPAFAHATLDRVAWSGGGFTGFVTSYEGMKEEAVAARAAAESAAAEAGAQAAVRLDELIAAGSFEGPAGPLTNLTVGTVEATPGNPLTDDIVASEVTSGTATKAALDGKYAPITRTARQRPANTIILMGDSITAYNGGKSTATPAQVIGPGTDSKGMHVWANIMLGKDLEVLGNSGIGGQKASQMLARFDTDVLAYNPAIVSILAGSNDLVGETTKADIQAMYTKALNAGILVLAHTIPPTTTSNAALEAYRLDVNDWIRRYARATPGIILADIAAAWHDTATAGFKALASYLADGVHPNTIGAQKAGYVIYKALRPFVPENRFRAAAAVAPYNLLTNPFLNGTGTTLPSGWTTSGSATYSYVPRTDGFAGQALRVTVPDSGFVSLQTNVTIDGTNLAAGDTIDFGYQVDVVSLSATPGTQRMYGMTQQYDGAAFTDKTADAYIDGGASYGSVAYPLPRATFRVPPHTVKTGKTLVQCLISFNGGGVYDVSGAYVRNLTKLGAL